MLEGELVEGRGEIDQRADRRGDLDAAHPALFVVAQSLVVRDDAEARVLDAVGRGQVQEGRGRQGERKLPEEGGRLVRDHRARVAGEREAAEVGEGVDVGDGAAGFGEEEGHGSTLRLPRRRECAPEGSVEGSRVLVTAEVRGSRYPARARLLDRRWEGSRGWGYGSRDTASSTSAQKRSTSRSSATAVGQSAGAGRRRSATVMPRVSVPVSSTSSGARRTSSRVGSIT